MAVVHKSMHRPPPKRDEIEERRGGGSGTQKFVHQKWPNQILLIIYFVFPHDGREGVPPPPPPTVYGHPNTSLPLFLPSTHAGWLSSACPSVRARPQTSQHTPGRVGPRAAGAKRRKDACAKRTRSHRQRPITALGLSLGRAMLTVRRQRMLRKTRDGALAYCFAPSHAINKTRCVALRGLRFRIMPLPMQLAPQ